MASFLTDANDAERSWNGIISLACVKNVMR